MTEDEIAQLEAANGLRQFDYAMDAVDFFLSPECPFSLRPSLLRGLRSIAVKDLESDGDQYRRGPVLIEKSSHIPPEAHLVEGLVEELCNYVNDNWHECSAFHLASYVMWRLNWIHPFGDGNGRTSRMASYIVLNIKLGFRLPGTSTIPDQIQRDRRAYFEALEAADKVDKSGGLDLSQMEQLIKSMLAKQLLTVMELAESSNGSK